MTINLGEDTKTTWLVGGAISLFAAAVTPVLSLFGGSLFVAMPGDGFGHGDVGNYLRVMWEGSWPYTIAELVIAAAAAAYLVQTFRVAPNLPWATVVQRAATLLIPAVLFMLLVTYVINTVFERGGGFTFTF